jgi:hypothetical protein
MIAPIGAAPTPSTDTITVGISQSSTGAREPLDLAVPRLAIPETADASAGNDNARNDGQHANARVLPIVLNAGILPSGAARSA